jgi:hypothetical protein
MWITVEVNPFFTSYVVEVKVDSVFKQHALEIYEGMGVKLHTSLTMTLGGELHTSAPLLQGREFPVPSEWEAWSTSLLVCTW